MTRSHGLGILLMGLMLAAAPPLSAAEYGIVEGIDHDKRYVVVGDWVYHLDAASRLNTGESQDASWLNLRVGNKVKITVKPRSRDRRDIVAEMWVLPASEPLPSGDED